MVTVPVILAGGIGERFWPASRSTLPKQLLNLTGSVSMLEKTIDRCKPLFKDPVKPLIVTGNTSYRAMKKVLPASVDYDVIVENQGKNTAPAICLAAAWIQKKYGDAVMVILSADHEIKPVSAFTAAVKTAVSYAVKQNALVIFGITPERPDTGYGYVNISDKVAGNEKSAVYRVNKFVEKPTADKAAEYVASKQYLWNSGMFIWKTSVILDEFKKSLPEMYQQVQNAGKKNFSKTAVDAYYAGAASISVDYGIMEHAQNVYAVAGTFTWDDVGAWEAMTRIHSQDAAGNTLVGGTAVALDCSKTIVFNQTSGSVAAIGLDNAVIVVAEGVTMAISRDKLPDLKKYLAAIKKGGKLPPELF